MARAPPIVWPRNRQLGNTAWPRRHRCRQTLDFAHTESQRGARARAVRRGEARQTGARQSATISPCLPICLSAWLPGQRYHVARPSATLLLTRHLCAAVGHEVLLGRSILTYRGRAEASGHATSQRRRLGRPAARYNSTWHGGVPRRTSEDQQRQSTIVSPMAATCMAGPFLN